MVSYCLSLILLLVGGVATAPVADIDENTELILVANAGKISRGYIFISRSSLKSNLFFDMVEKN